MNSEQDAVAWLEARFVRDQEIIKIYHSVEPTAEADDEAQARYVYLFNSHHCAITAPMFTVKEDHQDGATAWRPRDERPASRIHDLPYIDDWTPEPL